jgi:PIN domain nuclease of toxin-antitoxin system
MANEPSLPEKYVLDACALIAFLNDEVGAEKVEQLIEQAHSGEVELFTSSVNLYEVYYDALRHSSPEMADSLLTDLYTMPMTVIETIDRTMIRAAGYYKTAHSMSVADSFALALANQLDAHLVSTDHHEFDPVDNSGDAKFFWVR